MLPPRLAPAALLTLTLAACANDSAPVDANAPQGAGSTVVVTSAAAPDDLSMFEPRQQPSFRQYGATASATASAPPPPEPRTLRAGETDESLPLRLVAHRRRPAGFVRAPRAPRPTCIGEEEDAGMRLSMTIHSRGRTLDVRFSRSETGVVTVSEGKDVLWREHVGSAGGATASTACSHDGWGVLVAGHYRHHDDVFDLFTGKKLGPGDVSAYAPDLSFALAPPQFSWASECYSWSRTFRIPTDGARRPFALATPPVPGEWTCDATSGAAPRLESDRPTVAISPDSARYAIASPQELSVYRATDDALVARYLRPPYAGLYRTDDVTKLTFSAAGDALLLSRDTYGRYRGEERPAESHWFTIEPR